MNRNIKYIALALLGMYSMSNPMAIPPTGSPLMAYPIIITMPPAPIPQTPSPSVLSQTAQLISYVLPWNNKKNALGYALVTIGTCAYKYWSDQRFKRIVNKAINKAVTTIGTKIDDVREYMHGRFGMIQETQSHHTQQLESILDGQRETHERLARIEEHLTKRHRRA